MQAEPAASAPYSVLPSPIPFLSVPSSPIASVPAPARTGALASRKLDAALPAVASSRDVEVIAVPAGPLFQDVSPEVTEPVRPKLKPRSRTKAALRTRPEARPRASSVPALGAEPGVAPSPDRDRDARRPDAPRRRGAAGLILLILALGCAAMAAAYFWPEL